VLAERVIPVTWLPRDRSTICKEVATPWDGEVLVFLIFPLGVAEVASLESLQSHLRGRQVQAGDMTIDVAGNVGQLHTRSIKLIEQDAEAALAHPTQIQGHAAVIIHRSVVGVRENFS
jgi:hypothetical protein